MGSPVNKISSNPRSNMIINGGMRHDQRREGAILTIGTGSSSVLYTADRWRQDRLITATTETSRSSGTGTPAGLSHFLQMSVTAGVSVSTGQFCEWLQPIEAYNIANTKFGTADAENLGLSFWVYSSVTGSHSGALRNHTGLRSYIFPFTINTANTWEYKEIVISGDVGGSWNLSDQNLLGMTVSFCHAAGTDFRTTAGSWQTGTFVGVTGGNNVTAVTGAIFRVTGVQLNIGTPKKIEQRPIQDELLDCQRYWRKYPHLRAVATSTSTTSFYVDLIPEMRAPPLAGQTGLLNIQNGVVNTTQSGLSINTSFNDENYVIGTAGLLSGLTLREPVHIGVPANNGHYVFFDAEF